MSAKGSAQDDATVRLEAFGGVCTALFKHMPAASQPQDQRLNMFY